jgi:hypothetical protein
MIRPIKYLDLNTCVLRVSALILSELTISKSVKIGELNKIVCKNLGDNARFNYLSSLNFLFLIGTINYDGTSDSIYLSNGAIKL